MKDIPFRAYAAVLLLLAAAIPAGAQPKKVAGEVPAPPAAPSPVQSERLPLPGDTIEDAIWIPALPFTHSYSNVGYSANYSVPCPYLYGPGPDVVYAYTPDDPVSVEVSLCNAGTDYDTKIIIYENDTAHDVACNDDACTSPDFPAPYVSRIAPIIFVPGNTYYIVVTGYVGSVGNYTLTVIPNERELGVRPDGTGAYPTIQAALDAAEPGDNIVLAPGVFTGAGNTDLEIGTTVLIRPESGVPGSCVIDCQGTGRGLSLLSPVQGTCLIQGVEFRHGNVSGEYGGGVRLSNASADFVDCTFTDNRAGYGGGASVEMSYARFRGCLFRYNRAFTQGGGLYLSTFGTTETISGCTFVSNKATSGGGAICVAWGEQCRIADCTIVDNDVNGTTGRGAGILSEDGGTPVEISNCIVAFNRAPGSGGVFVANGLAVCCDLYGNQPSDWGGDSGLIGDGTIFLDPLFCDPAGEDFGLMPDSPCAPFTPPNPQCDLIGAHPVGCAEPSAVATKATEGLRLSAHPNPVTNGCLLLAESASAGAFTIRIFDAAGRRVRELHGAAAGGASGKGSAIARVLWDGKDEAGQSVPSGVYLLRASDGAATRGPTPLRIVVIR